jgi:hypothetical protein
MMELTWTAQHGWPLLDLTYIMSTLPSSFSDSSTPDAYRTDIPNIRHPYVNSFILRLIILQSSVLG